MDVSESLSHRSHIGLSLHTGKVQVSTGQSILHAGVGTELGQAVVTVSRVSKCIGPGQIELDQGVSTVSCYLLSQDVKIGNIVLINPA